MVALTKLLFHKMILVTRYLRNYNSLHLKGKLCLSQYKMHKFAILHFHQCDLCRCGRQVVSVATLGDF